MTILSVTGCEVDDPCQVIYRPSKCQSCRCVLKASISGRFANKRLIILNCLQFIIFELVIIQGDFVSLLDFLVCQFAKPFHALLRDQATVSAWDFSQPSDCLIAAAEIKDSTRSFCFHDFEIRLAFSLRTLQV